MNNKYLPSLVTGFAAGVLLSVPGVKNFVFFITIPAAVYFALLLNIKLNDGSLPVKTRTAILFGVLTGLWAAFFSSMFDTLLTYVSRNNDFVEAFPEMQKRVQELNLGKISEEVIGMFKKMYSDIKYKGFSPLYTFVLLISNFFMDVLFGILGGLISRIYLNKPKPQQ